VPSRPAAAYTDFCAPVPVTITGHSGDEMEPFISKDGRYLFFNNRNDPAAALQLDRFPVRLHLADDDLGQRHDWARARRTREAGAGSPSPCDFRCIFGPFPESTFWG